MAREGIESLCSRQPEGGGGSGEETERDSLRQLGGGSRGRRFDEL